MEIQNSVPDLELQVDYRILPIRALRMTARKKLAGFLDLEGTLVVVNEGASDEQDVVNDCNGLAELAGLTYQTIRRLQRSESPTMKFLDTWNDQTASVGNLWNFLISLERYDVVVACRRTIFRDCELYLEQQDLERAAAHYDIQRLQDPTVSNSEMIVDETKFVTDEDVLTQRKTYYDAFICYTDDDREDRDFVRVIIKELEERRGLKLFVPGRNDLPGSAQHTVTAYLIEERCKRVVIVMSKPFMKSQVCDFQVKFAFALSPGARSKKLIPVVREKGTIIPRILQFLAVCDFTKADILDWVWDRLYTAIIAPIGKQTYFESEDPNNPYGEITLKDITFPAFKRLDDVANNNDTACHASPNHEPRILYNRDQPSASPMQDSPYLRSEDQMSCSDNQSYTQSHDSTQMSCSDSQHEAIENSDSFKPKLSLLSSLLGRKKKPKKSKTKPQNETVARSPCSIQHSNSHVVSSTNRSAPVVINHHGNHCRRDLDEYSFVSSGSISEDLQSSADQMEMDEI